MSSTELLIKEIDNSHKIANDALNDRLLEKYIEVFDDNLKYKQLDGRIIGKIGLSNNIKSYFNRVVNYTSSFRRLSFKIEKDIVVEELIQDAMVSLRVFVFFSKTWKVERKGIYSWKNIDHSWKIINVEILEEKMI